MEARHGTAAGRSGLGHFTTDSLWVGEEGEVDFLPLSIVLK